MLHFVLFTSMFSALCALTLCMATERLILLHNPLSFTPFHFFIMGCTLMVYNVHYLVKKSSAQISDQYAWVTKNRKWNYTFLSLGFLLCAIYVWDMPRLVWQACIGLAALSFAYSLPFLPFKNKHRLKDIGWLKIIILAVVWTIVTAVLPILYWQKNPFDLPYELLLRFVFLFILCLAFDLRDMQVDLEAGIYTLPNKFGVKNTYYLIYLLSILFVVLAVFQYYHFGILDRLLMNIISSIAFILGITYVRKYPSDKNYLLFVDGQMLLNGLLILIV